MQIEMKTIFLLAGNRQKTAGMINPTQNIGLIDQKSEVDGSTGVGFIDGTAITNMNRDNIRSRICPFEEVTTYLAVAMREFCWSPSAN
jgi:hypothetical protein